MSEVIAFIILYKWWLAALAPFILAAIVLKLRG